MICFHNHPNGNPEPSAADRAFTATLMQALALVDIRLLDHIEARKASPAWLREAGSNDPAGLPERLNDLASWFCR